MTLARYYLPELLKGDFKFSSDEERHVAGAKRQRVGDEFEVFDGRGNICRVVISELKSRRVVIEPVGEVHAFKKNSPVIEVAFAVPKGKRLQYLVEKLTELGVSVITPVVFERSVAGGNDPVQKYLRWAIEACKQSRNPWLPEVSSPVNFRDYISEKSNVLMADYTGESLFTLAEDSGYSFDNSSCLIGPEGGFSEEEFALAEKLGVRKIRLAPNILRIETAAVAFASAIMSLEK